jgi:hypothetical protein
MVAVMEIVFFRMNFGALAECEDICPFVHFISEINEQISMKFGVVALHRKNIG